MGLLVPASGYLLSFHTFRSEVAVLTFGVALELFGISIAIVGLVKTNKYFELPSLQTVVWAWIKRFPRWTRQHRISVGSGAFTVTTAKARGYAWTRVKPEDTVEKKLDALVQNVDRLRKDLSTTQGELDALADKYEERLKGESQARETVERKLHKTIKRVLTDGYGVSLVGLLWLMVGLVLTNFANFLL